MINTVDFLYTSCKLSVVATIPHTSLLLIKLEEKSILVHKLMNFANQLTVNTVCFQLTECRFCLDLAGIGYKKV